MWNQQYIFEDWLCKYKDADKTLNQFLNIFSYSFWSYTVIQKPIDFAL